MTAFDLGLVNDFVAALFCGAFVGMERERGKGPARPGATPEARPGSAPDPAAEAEPDARNIAGIRSHILVALLGCVARILDRDVGPAPAFTALAFGALALFVVTAFAIRAARTGHYGMTSAPVLLLTFMLGVMCFSDQRPLALALAVVITATLAAKAPLHSFVRALTPAEVRAAVTFGLVALVLLPLLPNRDFGPRDWPWLAARLQEAGVGAATIDQLGLVNPYQLWLLVVVISGVGFVGYVLVRWLGPGRGLVLTGFTGGLVSSTSVALAMAQQSRRTPEWRDPITAAVLAACAVMAVRVLVVACALHPALFAVLGPPLGALLLANVGLALWCTRRRGDAGAGDPVRIATPLALWPALQLAGLILLVRVLSEVALLAIGDAGLLAMAALSGLVDVDAITVATSQQAAAGRVGTGIAVAAICIAVATNTIVKGALVLTAGDRATGRRTFAALLATLACSLVTLLLVALVRGGFG